MVLADAGAGDDGGPAGGDQSCADGTTMFGYESDDDDCKYHVKWKASLPYAKERTASPSRSS
jgi:hypothetical protein